MVAKTTWTPVSESLPENDEGVLVIVNGNPVPNITLHNAYQLAVYKYFRNVEIIKNIDYDLQSLVDKLISSTK